MKYYILSTMGFHLYSTVLHAFTKARNDYMEMMLHHGSTLLLYGFSYYVGRVEAGTIIMFLHDIADIPCGFVRCFSETIYSNVAILSAVAMMISWFYTRLLIFPQVIYWTYKDVYDGNYPLFSNFCLIMLCCLLVLHYYWFYVLYLTFKRYMT